jgi:Uncharacterized protein SCO1/SenC/PrrC, involved in biogenesis of respiratory and photosynthetic systems, COG1999
MSPVPFSIWRQHAANSARMQKKCRVSLFSLDPDRDTPERVKRYVTGFDQTFIGLRGSDSELSPTMQDYGVTSIRRELPGSMIKYTIDHSTFGIAIRGLKPTAKFNRRYATMEDFNPAVS